MNIYNSKNILVLPLFTGGMPRFIFQVPETQISECIHFLSQYEEVESFHQMTTFLMVKLAQNDSRTEAFLKELALFFPYSFRELCQAKCRDDSDCLNTALKGKYCWVHQETSPTTGAPANVCDHC